MARKAKLTKRSVEALTSDVATGQMVWDTELTGFGVRVFPSGAKTYMAQYRSPKTGKTKKHKIGRHGALTVEEARREAQRVMGRVAAQEDPAAARAEERAAPTVQHLWERWFADHVSQKLKPRTQEEYARTYRRHVQPTLGPLKVKDVTLGDVNQAILSLGGHHHQANRTRALLRTLFEYGDRLGFRPDGKNPAHHATRFKEKRRERPLSPEDMARIEAAIDAAEGEGDISVFVAGAFRLLIWTGARLNEIRTLKWDFVQGDLVKLPDSKTGPKTLVLGHQAAAALRAIPRSEDNPYVVQGEVPGEPAINLQKPWRRIRKRAGLEDVRIHDLRHHFCSVLANSGMAIQDVQQLVGHRQVTTTMRYVHTSEEAMRRAAQAASQVMGARTVAPEPQPLKSSLRIVR